MPASPEDLFVLLDRLGISTTTVEHPPLFTVEQSQALRGMIPGGHTKNLFLIDRKNRLFLVSAEENANVDLKRLHSKIGASGRFSFGKPELLTATLGVPPGSVTAFALINDGQQRVCVVFDSELMHHATINCHPLENTATTNIARDDLLRFIRACGHEPRIASLAGTKPNQGR